MFYLPFLGLLIVFFGTWLFKAKNIFNVVGGDDEAYCGDLKLDYTI